LIRNWISGAEVQYPVPVHPANELPTRNEPGRDGPGRDSPGRDSPGRDSPGRDSRGILKSSRLIALLVVLGCHVGVIALLVAQSASPKVSGDAANPPLELVYLPPVKFPQALADSAHPKHVNVSVGLALAPPSLDISSAPAPVSQNGGGGAGVNWTAEAHRAVKAFEIRRDEHVIHSVLGTSPWDGWLPLGEHHAGDKYRTQSGDWIVWIDSNCYQIASWRDGTPVRDQNPPQTICVNKR
jgi:hypothetical protein